MDFQRYSSVSATTSYVLGEFYWEVAVGEKAMVADFINPPFVLSSERSGKEIVWSRGTYLEPSEVWQSFRMPGYPPVREGVGANQPSPTLEAANGVYRWFALFGAALVLLFVAFQITAKEQVFFSHPFDSFGLGPWAPPPAGAPPMQESAAFFSDPIDLQGHTSNVQAKISSSVENGWVAANCALINDDTGSVHAFGLEASYYHGYEDGESWSEGSPTGTEYLANVPPGRYVVRVEPEWEVGKRMPDFQLQLTWGVPRILHFLIALVLLCLIPLIAWWREKAFERRRWQDSTFNTGGGLLSTLTSGSDDDGDDE
jgi:hypothetical protein